MYSMYTTTGTIFLYILYLFLIFGRMGTADIRCLRTHYIHGVYHILNVKYKGQQLFCHDISNCFKRFLSKLTAGYSDTTLCSTMASHKVRKRPDVETA